MHKLVEEGVQAELARWENASAGVIPAVLADSRPASAYAVSLHAFVPKGWSEISVKAALGRIVVALEREEKQQRKRREGAAGAAGVASAACAAGAAGAADGSPTPPSSHAVVALAIRANFVAARGGWEQLRLPGVLVQMYREVEAQAN